MSELSRHKRCGQPPGQSSWADDVSSTAVASSPSVLENTGGAGSEGVRVGKSYAALLSSNLPSTWNKNVLEIVLEKDTRGSFNVSEADCASVMRKLGLDTRPGIHVESVQICPNGRGVLLITLKKEVPIEMFCRHDVFQVTQSDSIRAVHVKPAGKRDVMDGYFV